MPWNQPIKKTAEKTNRSYLPILTISACLIVSIIAFYLSHDSNKSEEKDYKERVISKKENAPKVKISRQKITSNSISNKVVENIPAKEINSNKVSNSNLPWANKPPRIIKMRAVDIKPRRFVYDAEEDIASLLEIEPGTSMFGDLPYTHFNKKFQQAIMQKVKINDNDDEYTKELKRQVQAVKDELKKIMLEGGDVGEEMRKARNELKELGRYRDSLIRELNSLRKTGNYSSQDMKDFETAANKLLSEKGLKPIKVPAVLLRNMELKERKTK